MVFVDIKNKLITITGKLFSVSNSRKIYWIKKFNNYQYYYDCNNNIIAYLGLLLQYLWQITQPLFSCRSHQKLPFVLVAFVYHTMPSMEFQDEAIWKTQIWIWPNKKAKTWVKKCHLDIQGEAIRRISSKPAILELQ